MVEADGRLGPGKASNNKRETSMLRKVFDTDDNTATAILRLVTGIVFFAHGAQKMLGWFGGYGFSGTMGFFTGAMHIPALFAFLAIAAEFFGSLGLILGFLTRIAAFGIGVNMLVAIGMVHSGYGVFMYFAALEALLHKGPLTITEIQGKVLLASGSMTAAVDRLEKKGLVVRRPAPIDRRAKVLDLTPEGRRVGEKAFRRHAVELESAMAVLKPSEKRQLRGLLKKLGLFAAGVGAGTGQQKEIFE